MQRKQVIALVLILHSLYFSKLWARYSLRYHTLTRGM